MIEGLSVTTDISFFIICSASMRDLSSNLANYKRHNHREAKKSYINVLTLLHCHYGFGAASSRNTGIHVAKGDVIVSLDSDMICPSTFLESHMVWFHKSAKIAIFLCLVFIRILGV